VPGLAHQRDPPPLVSQLQQGDAAVGELEAPEAGEGAVERLHQQDFEHGVVGEDGDGLALSFRDAEQGGPGAVLDVGEALPFGHDDGLGAGVPEGEGSGVHRLHFGGGASLPEAVADLLEVVVGFDAHSETHAGGEGEGGAERAGEVAGDYPVERDILEGIGDGVGLAQSDIVQRHVDLPLKASFPVPRRLAVADEEDPFSRSSLR